MRFPPTHRGLTLAAILACLAPGIARANCVEFEGIQHCSIKNATLSLSSDGQRLLVKGLGANGEDGVTSHLDDAAYWSAELRIPSPSVGDKTRLTAVADGQVASRVRFELVNDGLQVNTVFTGAAGDRTYRVGVYSGGQMIHEVFGADSSTNITINRFPVPIPIPWPDPWPEPWPPIIVFNISQQGACVWQASFDEAVEVWSDGVLVGAGDEIRLQEDVQGAGHYFYGAFEAMRIQSNGPMVVVTDEVTISNGF